MLLKFSFRKSPTRVTRICHKVANMQLFVRGLNSVETLEVSPSDTIASFKTQLTQLKRITEEFVLNCEGNALENDACVSSLLSFELNLTVPLLGRKVHGSLARAGKVKGYPFKGEKQEKRKKNKKTSRAKKRIQYNRRFVNFVHGFGRRRSPNANSS